MLRIRFIEGGEVTLHLKHRRIVTILLAGLPSHNCQVFNVQCLYYGISIIFLPTA